MHAFSGIAQVRALAFHSISFSVNHIPSCVRRPLAIPRTPPTPYPAIDAPHPPARDLGVVIIGIAFEFSKRLPALVDQPDVPGGQVGFVHRPVGIVRYLVRRGGVRPPEVANVFVFVVHCFGASRMMRGATKQHGQRTGERLHVIINVAEGPPDFGHDFGLSSEPDEGGFHAVCLSSIARASTIASAAVLSWTRTRSASGRARSADSFAVRPSSRPSSGLSSFAARGN